MRHRVWSVGALGNPLAVCSMELTPRQGSDRKGRSGLIGIGAPCRKEWASCYANPSVESDAEGMG